MAVIFEIRLVGRAYPTRNFYLCTVNSFSWVCIYFNAYDYDVHSTRFPVHFIITKYPNASAVSSCISLNTCCIFCWVYFCIWIVNAYLAVAVKYNLKLESSPFLASSISIFPLKKPTSSFHFLLLTWESEKGEVDIYVRFILKWKNEWMDGWREKKREE